MKPARDEIDNAKRILGTDDPHQIIGFLAQKIATLESMPPVRLSEIDGMKLLSMIEREIRREFEWWNNGTGETLIPVRFSEFFVRQKIKLSREIADRLGVDFIIDPEIIKWANAEEVKK